MPQPDSTTAALEEARDRHLAAGGRLPLPQDLRRIARWVRRGETLTREAHTQWHDLLAEAERDALLAEDEAAEAAHATACARRDILGREQAARLDELEARLAAVERSVRGDP